MRYFLLFFVVASLLQVQVAVAQSNCDPARIQEVVTDVMAYPDKYEGARNLAIQMDVQVAKGNIKPKDKDKALTDVWEYKIRKGAQCPIPAALEERVLFLLFGEDDEGQDCDIGHYKRTIDRELKRLKKSADYDRIVDAAIGQAAQSLGANTVQSFQQKIQDPAFKELFVRALIEVKVLTEHECANAKAPIMQTFNQL